MAAAENRRARCAASKGHGASDAEHSTVTVAGSRSRRGRCVPAIGGFEPGPRRLAPVARTEPRRRSRRRRGLLKDWPRAGRRWPGGPRAPARATRRLLSQRPPLYARRAGRYRIRDRLRRRQRQAAVGNAAWHPLQQRPRRRTAGDADDRRRSGLCVRRQRRPERARRRDRQAALDGQRAQAVSAARTSAGG